MAANDKQVGGVHYRSAIQHWDYVVANDLDYFQGQITKYVTRWRMKNGITDLYKARHFLEKYIELAEEEAKEHATIGFLEAEERARQLAEDEAEANGGYVNQDR